MPQGRKLSLLALKYYRNWRNISTPPISLHSNPIQSSQSIYRSTHFSLYPAPLGNGAPEEMKKPHTPTSGGHCSTPHCKPPKAKEAALNGWPLYYLTGTAGPGRPCFRPPCRALWVRPRSWLLEPPRRIGGVCDDLMVNCCPLPHHRQIYER